MSDLNEAAARHEQADRLRDTPTSYFQSPVVKAALLEVGFGSWTEIEANVRETLDALGKVET